MKELHFRETAKGNFSIVRRSYMSWPQVKNFNFFNISGHLATQNMSTCDNKLVSNNPACDNKLVSNNPACDNKLVNNRLMQTSVRREDGKRPFADSTNIPSTSRQRIDQTPVSSGSTPNLSDIWPLWEQLSQEQVRNFVIEKVESTLTEIREKNEVKIPDESQHVNQLFDERTEQYYPVPSPTSFRILKEKSMNDVIKVLEMILHRKKTTNNFVTMTQEGYNWYEGKDAFYRVLTNVSHLLGVPTSYLGFTSSGKGFCYGPLSCTDDLGKPCCFDGRQNLVLEFPQWCNHWVLAPTVKFLAVVEDGGTADYMATMFRSNQNCLVVTGTGMADIPTKRFVRFLTGKFPHLKLPYFGNCNPRGYHIYSVWKHGCPNSLYSGENLATPKLIHCGLKVRQLEQLRQVQTLEALNQDDFHTIAMMRSQKVNQGQTQRAKIMQQSLDLFVEKKEKGQLQFVGARLEQYILKMLNNNQIYV